MSPQGKPAGASNPATRGIALIVIAVILGLVILSAGSADEEGLTDEAANEETTTTTAPDGSTGTDSTSPTTATDDTQPSTSTVAPAQLGIVVANATEPAEPGLAGDTADLLSAAGYTMILDTANTGAVATSIVYHAEGYEADAAAVAAALGLPATAVQLMPVSPPVDLAGGSILVLAGADRVSGAATADADTEATEPDIATDDAEG